MKKKILIATLLALAVGAYFVYYMYNKPHQSIADETAAYTIEATTLASDYENDEKLANSKYLGKVVEVRGIIAEKTRDSKGKFNITLQGKELSGIGCEFDPKSKSQVENLKEGQEVSIKGICTGVLMDVVLVDCVVEENK